MTWPIHVIEKGPSQELLFDSLRVLVRGRHRISVEFSLESCDKATVVINMLKRTGRTSYLWSGSLIKLHSSRREYRAGGPNRLTVRGSYNTHKKHGTFRFQKVKVAFHLDFNSYMLSTPTEWHINVVQLNSGLYELYFCNAVLWQVCRCSLDVTLDDKQSDERALKLVFKADQVQIKKALETLLGRVRFQEYGPPLTGRSFIIGEGRGFELT